MFSRIASTSAFTSASVTQGSASGVPPAEAQLNRFISGSFAAICFKLFCLRIQCHDNAIVTIIAVRSNGTERKGPTGPEQGTAFVA